MKDEEWTNNNNLSPKPRGVDHPSRAGVLPKQCRAVMS